MSNGGNGKPKTNGHLRANGAEAPEDTLIGVILDRSGSMGSCREATITGFNRFLNAQQRDAVGGRASMSLTQFDDRYEINFVGEPIDNVPELDAQSYVPRGQTALHDAIGRTIHETEAWVREQQWNDRVLILIITDGQENASREYDLRAVRALIERKEQDGWNFAYMGANQDSFAVGERMGVRGDFTDDYASTPAGVRGNFAKLAEKTSLYRMAKEKGLAAAAFFDKPEHEEPARASGKLAPKK
ncbi:MAG: vWA domain-containing protein [bacterium]